MLGIWLSRVEILSNKNVGSEWQLVTCEMTLKHLEVSTVGAGIVGPSSEHRFAWPWSLRQRCVVVGMTSTLWCDNIFSVGKGTYFIAKYILTSSKSESTQKSSAVSTGQIRLNKPSKYRTVLLLVHCIQPLWLFNSSTFKCMSTAPFARAVRTSLFIHLFTGPSLVHRWPFCSNGTRVSMSNQRLQT